MPDRAPTKYGLCTGCLCPQVITMDGTLRNHADPKRPGTHCSGSHKRPLSKDTIEQHRADALKAALVQREGEVRQPRAIYDAARRQLDRSCEFADHVHGQQVDAIEREFKTLASHLEGLNA